MPRSGEPGNIPGSPDRLTLVHLSFLKRFEILFSRRIAISRSLYKLSQLRVWRYFFIL